MMPRIALIHATRLAITPIEEAAQSLWPEAETISILDESLAIDRRRSEQLSPVLWDRIVALAAYARTTSPNGILFTCSAFGAAIDHAAQHSSLPIMKPNEAMFDAAFRQGDRVAMIYTFPPAAAGMEQEFMAAARGGTATLKSYFCEDALEAKQAGQHAKHDRLVAQTAKQIDDADVILLGQFSMSSAAHDVRESVPVPVLTSPEAAIAEMRRRIEAQTRSTAC